MTTAQRTPSPSRRRLFAEGFATSAGAMVVLSTVASVLNYASNLIFGRLLTPESFGDLTAMLALVLILSVPTGAAQTLIADRIATLRAEGRESRVQFLIRHGAGHVLVISICVGLLYALAIPLVVDVFDLAALGPALATLPLLTISFFIPFVYGVLQGLERFALLGAMLVAAAASRIIFGVPWALINDDAGGAGGALAGQAIGNLCVVLAAWWVLGALRERQGTGAARTGLRRRLDRRSINASIAFVGFALLSNLDILMAKVWLPAEEAGFYAALSTIQKIVLFLPAAVAIVMVPSAAKARVEVGSGGRALKIASVIVAGTVAIAAVPVALAPHFVVTTMFGDKYASAEPGVLPMVVAGASLSLIYLLVVYTVTIRNHAWARLLFVGVAAQVVGISLFHDSAAQVATVQAVVVTGTVLINEFFYHPLLIAERWVLGRTSE